MHRKTIYVLCLALVAALLPASTRAEEPQKTHLFILSGQSNMSFEEKKDFAAHLEKALPGERIGVVRHAVGYKLDRSAQPTRIKFNVTFPPPGSGATPTPKDGLVPGILEFLDDDTLRLCYRESGWKNTDPPEARRYPEGLYSDGDMNLWILRRSGP